MFIYASTETISNVDDCKEIDDKNPTLTKYDEEWIFFFFVRKRMLVRFPRYFLPSVDSNIKCWITKLCLLLTHAYTYKYTSESFVAHTDFEYCVVAGLLLLMLLHAFCTMHITNAYYHHQVQRRHQFIFLLFHLWRVCTFYFPLEWKFAWI